MDRPTHIERNIGVPNRCPYLVGVAAHVTDLHVESPSSYIVEREREDSPHHERLTDDLCSNE